MCVLVATGACPTSTGACPTTAGAVKSGAWSNGAGRGAGASRGACNNGAAGANKWLAEAPEMATNTVRATM